MKHKYFKFFFKKGHFELFVGRIAMAQTYRIERKISKKTSRQRFPVDFLPIVYKM